MDRKTKVAFGFLKFAGRFYGWAFRSIFRLVKKSDEHIRVIEERRRMKDAIQRQRSSIQPPR
jgi:hypothetical protein